MAEVLFAAEVLPVGVLYPAGYHLFVRNVAGVFEQLQPNHQPDGVSRTSNTCRIQANKTGLTRLPIDLLAELHQRVTQVNQVAQLLAKEVRISRL